MILFTKDGCKKCDYVKANVDLGSLDIEVIDLTVMTKESLSELAWCEAVMLAETKLPILVLDDLTLVTGAINIKNYLRIWGKT